MVIKMSISDRREIACLTLMCVAAITGLAALHWHDLNYPACAGCDGSSYGHIAFAIKRMGLFAPWVDNDLRTYAYPLFISLVSSEQDLTLPMAGYFTPNVAIVQSALYIASCLVLFFVVYPTSRTAAWCCAVGLLWNPFVINYVPLRLTEGLNASVLVALTAIVCALSLRERGLILSYVLILAGGMTAGFAMVLRPANFVVVGAWLGFLVFYIWRFGRQRTGLGICAIVGLTIPLFPQILLNAVYHGTFTPFPAMGLGSVEGRLGVLAVKYETNVSGVDLLRLFYRNPFIDQREASELSWQIYLWRPQQGIPTMLAHVFNSVNHRYFFTYVYDLQPWYYLPMNATNHLLLFAAGASVVSFSHSRWRQAINCSSAPAADGLWLFLLLGFVLTCGVNAVSLPETRFGLAVLCLSGPLAALGIFKWIFASSRSRIMIFGLCLLYILGAKLLSDWMLALEICDAAGSNCHRLSY
jgi:hypothetical protein